MIAVIAVIRRAVPRRRRLGRLFVARIVPPFARELVIRGGDRAAEQTKMSNGQVPPLPGNRRHAAIGAKIVPWRQSGDG